MTQAQAIIEEFKPIRRNSLLGFCRIRMPSGVIFHDVGVHFSHGSFWAIPASKPQMGRDGTQLRAKDGKPLWVPIVTFATKELRDRFSVVVVGALRASHPEAFEEAQELADQASGGAL
jgi:hypothetical protein